MTAGVDGWWHLNGESQQVFSVQAIAVESDIIKLSPTRAVAWKQGSGVIRLINGREGFCYLSAVSGGLRGAGEAVRVGLEQDGWRYLSGKAAVPLYAMAAVRRRVTFRRWPCDRRHVMRGRVPSSSSASFGSEPAGSCSPHRAW